MTRAVRKPTTTRGAIPLLAIAAALATLALAAPPAAADGSPKGMVAFFVQSACPDGWSTASYATGRLLVGVTDGEQVGKTVGTPLADREDRTHSHRYSAEIRLNHKDITGANGGNTQGAEHTHSQSATGDTAKTASGLPFTQLVICEKG